MGAVLLAEPRWGAAAQALVDGCVDLPGDEERIALMTAVCACQAHRYSTGPRLRVRP
jgi:hypothetical protein